MFETGKSPVAIVDEKGLSQVSDTGELEQFCNEAIEANRQIDPRTVAAAPGTAVSTAITIASTAASRVVNRALVAMIENADSLVSDASNRSRIAARYSVAIAACSTRSTTCSRRP